MKAKTFILVIKFIGFCFHHLKLVFLDWLMYFMIIFWFVSVFSLGHNGYGQCGRTIVEGENYRQVHLSLSIPTYILITELPPDNNHPKSRQNVVFIWNGLNSEVFLVHDKKHRFQNAWLLLRGWLVFGGVLLDGTTVYDTVESRSW